MIDKVFKGGFAVTRLLNKCAAIVMNTYASSFLYVNNKLV